MDTVQVSGGLIVQVWRDTTREKVVAEPNVLLIELPAGKAVCGMRVINGQLAEGR